MRQLNLEIILATLFVAQPCRIVSQVGLEPAQSISTKKKGLYRFMNELDCLIFGFRLLRKSL